MFRGVLVILSRIFISLYENERVLHYIAAGHRKHIHDFRLVWASQAPTAQSHRRQYAVICHHPAVVGNSFGRILFPGAGQPHRVHGQRRHILADAAQSHPGSDNACHLHPLHCGLLQRRIAAVEPFRRLRLPDTRRLFRLYEIDIRLTFSPEASSK